MAVPKRKTTRSKRNSRRSHDALEESNIVMHPVTGEYMRSHHISPDGYYGKKRIIKPKIKGN